METIYVFADEALEATARELQSKYKVIRLKAADTIAPRHGVVVAAAPCVAAGSPLTSANPHRRLLLVGDGAELAAAPPEVIGAAFTFLPRACPPGVLAQQVEAALRDIQVRVKAEGIEARLERQTKMTRELNRIGAALSNEHNTELLLELIVRASRAITRSDAATLYLVEPDEAGAERLRIKFNQNQSVNAHFEEFTIPVSSESIAGYVAKAGAPLAIDDVYDLPAGVPYSFNGSFDLKIGYRCKSMLVIPLQDAYGKVIGVLQLINHKTDPEARLKTKEAVANFVLPYPEEMVEIAASLGSQAAVALENSMLYQNIKNLFEGFVKASVTAIEQRDPTTSGHSERVANLTVGLAEVVDRSGDPPFADVRFSRDQIVEIRYASLLHDFGKVGVRESVLVKAKKLYPRQTELLRWRFGFYRNAVRLDYSQRKLDYVASKGLDAYLAAQADLDAELERELRRADEMWSEVLRSNEPTVLSEGSFDRLVEIAGQTFESFDGTRVSLLSDEEVATLSIPKGSLNEEERREIESHVTHTFRFLSKIPWIDQWSNIPLIAAYHHEKLDGTGYPNGVVEGGIPIQSRMMTVSDIFDALTAADRPYKKAMPVERALGILESEAKSGKLDGTLFRLFVDSKVFEPVIGAQ